MTTPTSTTSRLNEALRTIADFPKPGIQFKDITPILAHADLLAEAVAELAAPFEKHGITKVVAMEARGFLFGPLLARHLGAGFVPARKPGKLPYATIAASYALEYGTDTIEMHTDALTADDVVLIHDDVIATGGTAKATLELVRSFDPRLAGFSFLIELSFLGGKLQLGTDVPVHSVITL